MLRSRMPFLPHPSDTGGDGDVSGQGTATITPASDTATPPNDGTPNPGDTGADSGADTPKTYTEAEVEKRLVGQGKEMKALQAKLAKFEKESQAAAEAAEAKKREEMSEIEKIQADLAATKQAAADAMAERDRIIAEREAEKAHQIATTTLSQYGPLSPRVSDLLPPAAHEVVDGQLTEAATAAIKQFAVDNPTLFRNAAAGDMPTAAGTTAAQKAAAAGDGYYARIARRNAGGQS